jgi:hypothetical protein
MLNPKLKISFLFDLHSGVNILPRFLNFSSAESQQILNQNGQGEGGQAVQRHGRAVGNSIDININISIEIVFWSFSN